MFKNKSTKFIIFEIIIMMIGVIGITLAVSYVMNSVNINVDTANLAIDYNGNLTLPSVNLVPILDSEVESNTENVMRINFSVKGASTNPNIPIIYDVILSDLVVDSALKSEYVKWELEKNGTVISSGSLDPWFDSIRDGKFWLTEIQQDLVRSSGTADNYEFRLWISEACTGDITTCTEDMDQSNMLNKSISGKIEVVLYTKGKEALERKPGINAAEYIPTLLSKNPDTMNNDDPDNNVRYMGANPNNYVRFNNELWRIIGVFDVASTYNGPTEKRLKIIRDESIGRYSWDNTSRYGSNDWSESALMKVLNNGAYWNRTSGTCPSGGNGATKSCDFSSNGLTEESKALIEDAVWNLGGTASYESALDGLPSHFYRYERGEIVYSDRPTYWVGMVGLMYPSDYGYACSGSTWGDALGWEKGTSCFEIPMSDWNIIGIECGEEYNIYLHLNDATDEEWTMTPYSSNSRTVFEVIHGESLFRHTAFNPNLVRPTVYLNSNVLITGGDGSQTSPYVLGLE